MTQDRLLVHFQGRNVEVRCGCDALLAEVRTRFGHSSICGRDGTHADRRMELRELAPGFVELRDSTGRTAAGSLLYVLHQLRKWLTMALASDRPDLLWLHASAVAAGGRAIVLAGPAGAGKSTLAVHLLAGPWRLMGDDLVPVRPRTAEALPLPFTPEVRTASPGDGRDPHALRDHTKSLAVVSADQIVDWPVRVDAVIFLEYALTWIEQPALKPLTATVGAQALAEQCAFRTGNGVKTLSDAMSLARRVSCYRLCYRDSTKAVAELQRLMVPWTDGSIARADHARSRA